MPKLTLALAFTALVVLASTITYSGFLVVGVLADYLGTGRFIAGLLLAALLARFPTISQGKLRVVGVLPKPVRRPVIAGVFALCFMHFLLQGEYVPAAFTGFTTAFLLGYPRLRRALFERMKAGFFKFTGQASSDKSDDMVIEGEFREKKD